MLKTLFTDKCPACKETLKVGQTHPLTNRVVKFCPGCHYQKEYHPALETYIETINY